MRLMLVLQSNAQLVDVYGKSKAETINSCIGITIGFSTNSWETLTEWAHRCGEKQIENSGHIIKEQLISASQLAAMPTATALVMVDNRYKFIAHLPFYNEMYDNSDWKAPRYVQASKGGKIKTLNFEAMVKSIKQKQMESTFSERASEKRPPETPFAFPFVEGNTRGTSQTSDIDSLITKIDAKIAELEAEEEAEKKKQSRKTEHHVFIIDNLGNKSKIALVLASATGISIESANRKLSNLPFKITFDTKKEAAKFVKDVTDAGGIATLKTP